MTRRGAPAHNRLSPEVLADREGRALVLLREGLPRREVIAKSKLPAAVIKRLAAEHGVPKLKPGNPVGNPLRHITRMSHAELDQLERRVRADRASRRKRPAPAVLRSAAYGGAYAEAPRPGPWVAAGALQRAPMRDDSDSPGGVCDDPMRRGHSFWFDTAPAARRGYR